jgi:hypothetical protein
VAKAVPALKGNIIALSNNTAIIDLLLILPPPCPRDSKRFNIGNLSGLINYHLVITYKGFGFKPGKRTF